MTTFLEIAVLASSTKSVFHYRLPEEWGRLETGCLVVVPFGNRRVQGVVLGEVARPEVTETRPVEEVLDPLPVLTPQQLRLARWMSTYYRATLDSCLSAMLPPGLAQHAEGLYELATPDFHPEKPLEQRLVKLLAERGPLRSGQIRRAFGPLTWEREAQRLVRAGAIRRRSILPPPSVRPKKIRMVQMALAPREAAAAIESLHVGSIPSNRRAATERRARVFESLLGEGKPLAAEWVYAASGAHLDDLRDMAEEGWVDLTYEETTRDPLSGRSFPAAVPPVLTGEQETALQPILAALLARRAERFLLFGITGSGKTEVYLRAAKAVVESGR
ncbi:MAG: hypothetical protein ABSA10_08515, partial [Anaerolineales bacterium]